MYSPIVVSVSASMPMPRRSADYEASSWDVGFLGSMAVVPLDECRMRTINELRTKLRHQLSACDCKPTRVLELIDSLQQLGIHYCFEEEIVETLRCVSDNRVQVLLEKDLHSTSLMFRLFRESGLEISQGVFEGFRDENNGWEACFLHSDPRGILSLYEASYLAFEGETLLDEAKALTTNFLEELKASTLDADLKEKVAYALDLPLHWRFPRFHTMWFMNTYAKYEDKDPELLEFARLDFNIAQLWYRREVKEISRWWMKTGLGEKMSFARNRAVENFLWAFAAASSDPRCGTSRKWIVKATCLAIVMDDAYDVYGTMDELQMFTDIVERWDVENIEKLPEYMQILFLAIVNHVDDFVYHVLKDKKVVTTLQMRRVWVQICKAFLDEAKWYHHHTMPTLEEYLDTATTSALAIFVMSYAYITNSKDIDLNILDWIHEKKGLTRFISLIIRFTNDLASSKNEHERGDSPKTIECYMNQEGVSEEEARNYVKYTINETWKKINENKFANPLLPKSLIDGLLDLGRACHFVYRNGDGYSFPGKEMRAQLKSLFFEQLPLDS